MVTADLQELVSSATIDAVLQPIARASGMPNAFYQDPSLFEIERDEVLGKTWACIGFASGWPTCSCLVPQLSSDREINILLKSSTTLCDIYCAVARG